MSEGFFKTDVSLEVKNGTEYYHYNVAKNTQSGKMEDECKN